MRNDWEKLMKDKLDSASLDDLLPGFELDAWQGIETKLEPVKEKKKSRRWLTHVAAAVGGILIGFVMFRLGGAEGAKSVVKDNRVAAKAVVENSRTNVAAVTASEISTEVKTVTTTKPVYLKKNRVKAVGPERSGPDFVVVETTQPTVVPVIKTGRAVHILDMNAAADANKAIAAARENANPDRGKVAVQLNRTGKAIHFMDVNDEYRDMAGKNNRQQPVQNGIRNWATQELNKAADRDHLPGAEPPLRTMFNEIIP